MKNVIFWCLLSLVCCVAAFADEVGEVTTSYKLIGPSHKIVVESFDDPKIKGVTCYLSRPVTGGISGGLGLAEDPSQGSVACRQTAAISVDRESLSEKPEVVSQHRTSLAFKSIQVVRMYHKAKDTLVYLVYSDKLVDGSPDNSISVVPLVKF